ncbi:uncharacterized protein LOC120347301 [Styela clava]
MYCAVTPAVGLVSINDIANNHPNLAGMLRTHTTPYYVGQPCPRVTAEDSYHSAMRMTYGHYNTHLQYQVMASTANDPRYLDSNPVNAYYRLLESGDSQTNPNVANEGIPLTKFIEEGLRSRTNLAFSFCDQYREVTKISADGAVSPTSISSIMLSNESSGYASSSGRSFESPSDSHTSDSQFSSSYNCNQRTKKRSRYVEHSNQRNESGDVLDKDAVRPRTRPAKPTRKSFIKVHERVNHSNRDETKTPECGLICQRKASSKSIEMLKTQMRNKPRNNEMEVDEPFDKYPEPKQHDSLCIRSGRTENKTTLPIKERIKRFEKLRDTCGGNPNRKSNNITLDEPKVEQRIYTNANAHQKKNKNATYTKSTIETKLEKAKKELKQSSRKMFLGMYEVQSVLGVGGGGTVYAGVRIADSKPIAIKRIMREKIKRWEKIQGRKVPQEIVLMLKVNGHKNVIRLLDWYECLDSFILILERPHNCVDLFDYIREVGTITEDEASFIFRQVVEAVKHIHSRGVLHRDIKDENVVINRETKKPRIIDFGCGTNLHDGAYTDFSGTPEFYPPEWFSKRVYQGRSAAAWSLGVLLYDMLCGEIPFKTKGKIMANILTFKAPVSQKAKHLIMWLLCSEPDARPDLNEVLKHPWLQNTKQ